MNLLLLERETGRVLGQIAILNLYPTMEQYVIRMTHGDITIELLPCMDGWRTCVGIVDRSEFEHLASREDFTFIGPQNRCPDCAARHEPRITIRHINEAVLPLPFTMPTFTGDIRWQATLPAGDVDFYLGNQPNQPEELNDEEEEVPPPNRD